VVVAAGCASLSGLSGGGDDASVRDAGGHDAGVHHDGTVTPHHDAKPPGDVAPVIGITCLNSSDCNGEAPLCCVDVAGKSFTTKCTSDKTCPQPEGGAAVEPCESLVGTGTAPSQGTCRTGVCAGYTCLNSPTLYACTNPDPGMCTPVGDAGAPDAPPPGDSGSEAGGGDAGPTDASSEDATDSGHCNHPSACAGHGVCCVTSGQGKSGVCIDALACGKVDGSYQLCTTGSLCRGDASCVAEMCPGVPMTLEVCSSNTACKP
jgi:hypothetical protein